MTLEKQIKEILEKPEVFELIEQCSTKVNGAGFLLYYVDETIFPGQIVYGQEPDLEKKLGLLAVANALDKAMGYQEFTIGPASFVFALQDANQELNAYLNAYAAQNYPTINPKNGLLLLIKLGHEKTTYETELSDYISDGGNRIHFSSLYHIACARSLIQLNSLRKRLPNVALVEGRFFPDSTQGNISSEGNILLYQQLKPLNNSSLRMELLAQLFGGFPGHPERPEGTEIYHKKEGVLDLQSRTLLL